jgi:hypothetical protein
MFAAWQKPKGGSSASDIAPAGRTARETTEPAFVPAKEGESRLDVAAASSDR